MYHKSLMIEWGTDVIMIENYWEPCHCSSLGSHHPIFLCMTPNIRKALIVCCHQLLDRELDNFNSQNSQAHYYAVPIILRLSQESHETTRWVSGLLPWWFNRMFTRSVYLIWNAWDQNNFRLFFYFGTFAYT